MTLYECQQKTIEDDNRSLKFVMFNGSKRIECTWLDVWLGLFIIDSYPKGFLKMNDTMKEYPNITCEII